MYIYVHSFFNDFSSISLHFYVQEAQMEISKLLEKADTDESLSNSVSDSEDKNAPTERGTYV